VSAKRRVPKFHGKLAKPGRPPPPPTGNWPLPEDHPPEALNAWHTEVLRYDMEGLALLCKHYGIEEPNPTVRYVLLALRLAWDFVPYFQPAGRPRGKKVDRVNGLNLALDVVEIRRRRSVRTDAQALSLLARRAGSAYRKRDPGSLRKSLQRARKDRGVKICLGIADELPAYRRGDGRQQLLNLARLMGRIT